METRLNMPRLVCSEPSVFDARTYPHKQVVLCMEPYEN